MCPEKRRKLAVHRMNESMIHTPCQDGDSDDVSSRRMH